MIAYHGTDYYNKIKRFKKSKSGSLGSDLIYFTDDMKTAYDYAIRRVGSGKLYTVELNITKPLVIPFDVEPVNFVLSENKAYKRKSQNTNYCYWLKATDYNKYRKLGYDAIIYRNEIAVFNPDVIKVLDVIDVSMK